VEVAVAVPGVKRLDGYSNQEFALSSVAYTLSFRRVAYTLSLVQWMGPMVGESALLEDPLGVSFSKRSAVYRVSNLWCWARPEMYS